MTYEKDPVIASLASRARDQIKAGVAELRGGHYLAAEVFLNAACATMQSLVVLLDADATPPKPLRKLAVVGKPDEEIADTPIPEWAEHKR